MSLDHGIPWTHGEKGGRYRVLDVVSGAGSLRGVPIVLYARVGARDGRVFARTYREFLAKMIPLPREVLPRQDH